MDDVASSAGRITHPLLLSRYDRYRLIEILVRHLRENYPSREAARGSQPAVAEAAHYAISTVSNIENLTRSLGDTRAARSRAVSRRTLLEVLVHGLGLDLDRLDTISWLFDGQPLTNTELRRFAPHLERPTDITPLQATTTQPETDSNRLRNLLLDQLEEVVKARFEGDKPLKADVTLFQATAPGRLAGSEATLDLERLPGQRLFLAGAPSHLAHPREFFYEERTVDAAFDDDRSARDREIEIGQLRYERYTENIRPGGYGERAIHSLAAIRRHVSDPDQSYESQADSYADLDHRRAQVRHLASLLSNPRDYPNFWVGIADDTPAFEMELKSTSAAIMRGARPAGARRPYWGIYYIFWNDETSVLQFYTGFERAWSSIPDISKDRLRVSDLLLSLCER